MEVNQLSTDELNALLGKLTEEKRRWEQPQTPPQFNPYQPRPLSLQQFIEDHGRGLPPVPLKDSDGRDLHDQILADGSVIHATGGQSGFFTSPNPGLPAIEADAKYWTLRLEMLEKDFSTLKIAMSGNGPGFNWPFAKYGPKPGDGSRCLEALEGPHHRSQESCRRGGRSAQGQSYFSEAEAG
jgi:hypothetical protein